MEEYKVVIEGKVITIPEDIYIAWNEDKDRYIFNGETLVDNPDYPQIVEERERARIHELKMTPLDFLKAIEAYGVTYDMVKQIMDANPVVERELRFCQNVYRKHPMIEQFATQFGITSEQLDNIFKAANGEEV